MEFCIQDPSYSDSKYLHEALLSAFDIGIEGGGAYAFASCSGIELLLHDESFRKFIETGTFFLIVGMDDITNKKALESLKALRDRYGNHLTTKVYIHNKRGSIFHPKYSWIKTVDGASCMM